MNSFFLSPGFGGLCAVIGAAIAYGAATLATRQKAKTDTDQRRQGEVTRTWDRFVWVMDHRSEFNPVLTVDLLDQLNATAERLGDQDLVAFARKMTTELIQAAEEPPAIDSSTTPPTQADTEHTDQEGT